MGCLQRRILVAAMTVAVFCCASGAAADPAATSPAESGRTLPREQRSLGILQRPRPQSAAAGVEGARAPGGLGLTQTVLALGGVLALALIGGAIVRGLARGQGGLRASLGAGGRAPAGVLEVIGRYPIARGSSLVLLKLDRRLLLLSQSVQGRLGAGAAFTTLCEITDPEEIASILVKARDAEGDSMSERFRGMLQRFDRTLDAPSTSDSGRRQRIDAGQDRAEFWDDGRQEIPVVDLTRDHPRGDGAGPIASLRRRLASLRPADGGPA